MDVSSVTSAYPKPSSDLVSSRSDGMDRADFLKMLVAEMTSQDPMNPMQNSEYASQLAQFSQVQELQKMSTTLDNSYQTNLLLAQSINNTMASSFIGQIARAERDQFKLGASGSTSLDYNLAGNATSVKMEIMDSSGKVIRTITGKPEVAGDHSMTWDGLDSDGNRVAAGDYTYKVTATGVKGTSVDAMTIFQGRITGVNYSSGGAVLMVGDVELQLNQIIEISDSNGRTKG
jgi:flagellar basal-body rod modification protein FlgD